MIHEIHDGFIESAQQIADWHQDEIKEISIEHDCAKCDDCSCQQMHVCNLMCGCQLPHNIVREIYFQERAEELERRIQQSLKRLETHEGLPWWKRMFS